MSHTLIHGLRNRYLRLILLSFVLHLMAVLSAAFFIAHDWLRLLVPPPATAVPERPPLAFELVDTPDDAKIKALNEPAKLASDKAATARNPASPPDLDLGAGFSNGIVPRMQNPEQAGAPAAAAESQAAAPTESESANKPTPRQNEFTSELLRQAEPSARTPKNATGNIERPASENLNTRAPDLGSFSLNTYEWDFAPYMLRLKRRIERNIFPPPAFTYMGMISGVTYLKFRIAPGGKMELLEVMEYTGHKSLMNTSVRAVDVSAPFEPLPGEFPEPFLEVTARFEYFIKR